MTQAVSIDQFTPHKIQANGLQHFAMSAGNPGDPLVLLVHGFPESWYSWRHQMPILAEMGYYAVAIDCRGYGETDAPEDISAYSQEHITADIKGIVEALGYSETVLVCHDYGASVCWQVALIYPELVKRIIGISIPFGGRPPTSPLEHMKKIFSDNFFYMLYFQDVGPADNEFNEDIKNSLLASYYGGSAEGTKKQLEPDTVAALLKRTRMFEDMPMPEKIPDWLSEEDLAYYTSRFEKHGFTPGINYYRNQDNYWKWSEHLHDKKVTQPANFIIGKFDIMYLINQKAIDRMPKYFEQLESVNVVENCGHWVQNEKPVQVNKILREVLS